MSDNDSAGEKIKSTDEGGRCQGGEGGLVFHARWVREASLGGSCEQRTQEVLRLSKSQGSEGPGDLGWG